MKKNKKKNKWIKPRHKTVRAILGVFVELYVKRRYGIKIEPCNDRRPLLILYNHQTGFDQFFVGAAFKQPIYYVATEDIFSMGFVSKLIRFLVEPIPIKKQTTDPRAVINCMKVAREGGTIAMAPEGNRTYGGKTGYIKESVATLARHLKLPIVLFRIEDGYGVQPRWSDVVRRGKMRAYVGRVIEPEEYATFSDEQLYKEICEGLYTDEGKVTGGEFKHKNLAQYLERAIYVCPYHGLSEFHSEGDVIECKRCGRRVRYQPDKSLVGVGEEFKFSSVSDWYDYQCDLISTLSLEDFGDEPIYEDDVSLYEVELYKRKRLIEKHSRLRFYKDRFEFEAPAGNVTLIPHDKVTATAVLGKNKFDIYYEGRVYQIKSEKRFCALKYVNLSYRYQNEKKETCNAKFLGL